MKLLLVILLFLFGVDAMAAFDLRNQAGNTLRVSGGHWAVYLTLAETFGWIPKGTERPKNLPENQPWNGQYASSDGQFVTDNDAKALAKILHGVAVNPKISIALQDVISNVEMQAERSGIAIPSQMRMKPEDFNKEFSPLLIFLYEGGFYIE